jgi:predicted SAM-dependent methyltransferase
MTEPLRLHIGGTVAKAGWRILNIQPGPDVDYVGTCVSLAQFTDGSVEEVYASHVLEHLGYHDELPRAMREIWRVLKVGGVCRISVPDFEILCHLFVNEHVPAHQRFPLMRIAFGGQEDAHDFHKVGLTWDFMVHFAREAGFTKIRRVERFDLFEDSSSITIVGFPICLNVEIEK